MFKKEQRAELSVAAGTCVCVPVAFLFFSPVQKIYMHYYRNMWRFVEEYIINWR